MRKETKKQYCYKKEYSRHYYKTIEFYNIRKS